MSIVDNGTAVISGGVVTYDCACEIHDLVANEYSIQLPMKLGDPARWSDTNDSDFTWQLLVTKGRYVGTLPKQCSAYCYKNYGVSLTSDTLTKIGNIIARHGLVREDKHYEWDLTDRFDWCDGDFGDSGSCFWGGNAGARDMLEDAGAFALRLYRPDGRGYARCWVLPQDGIYYMFNAYGEPLVTLARILATSKGYSYKRVTLYNNDELSGTLYLNNNGKGYAIAPQTVLDTLPDAHDFRLKEQSRTCTCTGCNRQVDEDVTFYVNDEPYCQSCFTDDFTSCTHCDTATPNEDIVYDHRDYPYCPYCADRQFSGTCEVCNRVSDDLIYVHSPTHASLVDVSCVDVLLVPAHRRGESYVACECGAYVHPLIEKCPSCARQIYEGGEVVNA